MFNYDYKKNTLIGTGILIKPYNILIKQKKISLENINTKATTITSKNGRNEICLEIKVTTFTILNLLQCVDILGPNSYHDIHLCMTYS